MVDSLIEKVGRVMDENNRLRQECTALEAERNRLQGESRAAQERITELENRQRLVELGQGFMGGGNDENKKRAQQQINRLMREIDRCIALMNR